MEIQRCGKWCGTSTGQCLSDYLVNAFVKHLVRQVVKARHKVLIHWNIDLTKFIYHTSGEYDFSGVSGIKWAIMPLWLIIQTNREASNSIFVIRRYHCWYKMMKNKLQMKELGYFPRLSRDNCVPLQKISRGLWKRGHHERISKDMFSISFVPFLSRENFWIWDKSL